jgi:DNA invertase Pin-like site-specific DNA recombinase
VRTREGIAIARANGNLKGKNPKPTLIPQAELIELYKSGEHTVSELAERLSTDRATVYRALERAGARVA